MAPIYLPAMSLPLLQARVFNLRYEARDIISVELRPASPEVDFPFTEAGSHIDLHLGNGLIRSYSLTNPGESQRYVVAVLKDRKSRGGSLYVHEQLRVGQVISISAPRNNFRLDEDACQNVLLAGEFSCREGVCGACETRVISGEVEHRDSILTQKERAANKSMMICVSSCKSGTLVLDA